jgi:CheY-like chemotaxis protein/HPt (histidine-containing phosphotransfer) domain-containing protein
MRAGLFRKTGTRGPSQRQVAQIFSWVASRLRNRPDSEHELTVNRLALSGAAIAYLMVAALLGHLDAEEMLREQGPYIAIYQIVSIILFCHLLYRPGVSVARRLIGMVFDLGLLSYGMHAGSETFALLYPIFLWVIFENGFRFGLPYLYAACGTSVLTFGAVIATTAFWQEHRGLATGLTLGLVLLPLYVSTLIHKLSAAKRQAPAFNRLTNELGERWPADIVRSRFVTTLATPLDSLKPAAGFQLACGNDSAERPAEPRAGAAVAHSRPLSILVAEDNRTKQKVVARILERAGHRATIVADGEAALDVLDVHEFDLVLMNVNIPVMNGIEATKFYRFASLGRRRVPIVALTADATDEVGRRCEEAGMDACITEPIEPHRLLEIIDMLVQDAGKNPQSASNASGAVRYNFTRPGNRTSPDAAVDLNTLNALESLGGTEFVDELTAQFLDDASDILRELTEATASGDVEAFREQVHKLRSIAANIGALGIYEMCLAWGQIASDKFASRGGTHLKGLCEEFERVYVALQGRLSKRNTSAGRTWAM